MLKFLGKGNAFDVDFGNTSAFYKDDKKLIIFDCGEDVFKKIVQFKLLENVKLVYVFITHLHSDHIGSLGTLIAYINFVYSKKLKLKIIYPDIDRLTQLLELMCIKKNQISIYNCKDILKEIPCFEVKQDHVDGSYGYIIKIQDKTVFYSGDTSVINTQALNMLQIGEIDYFYHEVSLFKTTLHTSVDELNRAIPKEFRERVYCMHLDNEAEQKIIQLGFKPVELYLEKSEKVVKK